MIAVLRADEGQGVPLVYVPGIDGTGDMLLGTAARLAERFRLLRLRYVADGEDTYPHLAASIDALLAELGLERVVLLTESFGGAVSLQLALDHPERVASLAVVNSFAYHPWRTRLLLSRVGSPVLQGRLFRVCRRVLSPVALFGPRGSKEVRAAFRDVGGIGLDAAYRRRLQMIRGLDLRPRLGELEAPLALFAADRDRIVPSVPAAREIQERVPHATLAVLRGAGHLVLPLPDEPWPERVAALAARGGF